MTDTLKCEHCIDAPSIVTKQISEKFWSAQVVCKVCGAAWPRVIAETEEEAVADAKAASS